MEFHYQVKPVCLDYSLGEINCFRLFFKGLIDSPNILSTPVLSSLQPPKAEMKKAGVSVAHLYSCPLSQKFPKISFCDGHICYVDSQYKRFLVKIEGTFEEYLNKFKKKTLSTLRRKVKKVAQENNSEQYFQVYSRPDEMDAFFEHARKISQKTYQENLLGDGLPDSQEFRQQIIRESAEGKVFGFLLFLKDTPIAYTLCPVYGDNIILYDYTGYDSEYSHYSPGIVLQFKILETIFNQNRIRFYDLCAGEGQHKELFATDFILCGNIYYFSSTFLHVPAVLLKLAFEQATFAAKWLLQLLGVKNRIKRLIRRFYGR